VIVERAVRLIEEEVVRPDELLVLTFSRKAASDLRQRLADRLRSFPSHRSNGAGRRRLPA
jgi:ATP-dependent exoDNAse (exonuclease V) beta subunit